MPTIFHVSCESYPNVSWRKALTSSPEGKLAEAWVPSWSEDFFLVPGFCWATAMNESASRARRIERFRMSVLSKFFSGFYLDQLTRARGPLPTYVFRYLSLLRLETAFR